MRVNLRGGDAFVAEHLLHGAEVGTAFDEVRGERMAEGVRTHRLFNACVLHPLLDEHEDHLAGEVRPSAVQKDVIFLALLDFQLFTFAIHVVVHRFHGRLTNRNQPFFVALANYFDEAVIKKEVGKTQGDKLAYTQPSAVHHLHHGAVAVTFRRT